MERGRGREEKMEVQGGREKQVEQREVGVGKGRGDGERGSRGEKGMKVVWWREMEAEGWREE